MVCKNRLTECLTKFSPQLLQGQDKKEGSIVKRSPFEQNTKKIETDKDFFRSLKRLLRLKMQ